MPVIQDNAATPLEAGQHPFWIASSLAIFAAIVAFVGLPVIGQDTIDYEDVRFREYLTAHGYDTSLMGIKTLEDDSAVDVTYGPSTATEKI